MLELLGLNAISQTSFLVNWCNSSCIALTQIHLEELPPPYWAQFETNSKSMSHGYRYFDLCSFSLSELINATLHILCWEIQLDFRGGLFSHRMNVERWSLKVINIFLKGWLRTSKRGKTSTKIRNKFFIGESSGLFSNI